MAQLKPDDRVACRTPTPGRAGITRIPRWKFDCVRAAILEVLRCGDAPWQELTGRVRGHLTAQQLEAMGSLGWHVAAVKLELEVRGEIRRRPGKGRQILKLGDAG